MSADPYLFRLAIRLNSGLADIDARRREKHRAFILSQQQADGGFSGREGDSDLYYTGFAVRALSMLGGLTPDESDSVGRFAKLHPLDRLNTIDLLSWIYTALVVQASGGEDLLADADANWAEQIVQRLERIRTGDGGYAKTSEGAAGSTYHSFLVALIYELVGQSLPRPNALVQFLYDRQRDDGGFVEIAPMKRSGTNPTAAAVALLNMYGGMDDEFREDVRDFLLEVYSPEGGFQANSRIPFADGLSTFTGLLTAQDLGFDRMIDGDKMERFVTDWLEFPTGGFRGASWDEQADVEYTFYGLGILGLLHPTNRTPNT